MRSAFSPLCILFRIWLIWLDSFDEKWNFHYDGNGLAGQLLQVERALIGVSSYRRKVVFSWALLLDYKNHEHLAWRFSAVLLCCEEISQNLLLALRFLPFWRFFSFLVSTLVSNVYGQKAILKYVVVIDRDPRFEFESKVCQVLVFMALLQINNVIQYVLHVQK